MQGWGGWGEMQSTKCLIYRPVKKNNAMNPGCGTEVKTKMFLPNSCLTMTRCSKSNAKNSHKPLQQIGALS